MFEQIGSMSTADQKDTVADIVNKWVEGAVQIDDLTVAGVRV